MTRPFRFYWAGQGHDEASKNTFDAIDWDALLDITKRLTEDVQCIFEGDFHAGGRHIVRRIVVPSQRNRWIARMPIMPSSTTGLSGSCWTRERQFTMQSEIATMKYLAKTTGIPIPEIFGYNTCLDTNPVGLPYILMHCIEGNMLFDLSGPEILNPKQREGIYRSIASIQCQLLDASVDQIGCLILDSSGDIDIGHLPAAFGFQGPFSLPADYFSSWVSQNPKFKNLAQLNDLSLKQVTQAFPRRLESLIHKLGKSGVSGKYPIVHPDFLPAQHSIERRV